MRRARPRSRRWPRQSRAARRGDAAPAARPATGRAISRGDPLERLQRQRLVRFVLEISDAAGRRCGCAPGRETSRPRRRAPSAVAARQARPRARSSSSGSAPIARSGSHLLSIRGPAVGPASQREASVRSGSSRTARLESASGVRLQRGPRSARSDRAARGRGRSPARARWRRRRTPGRARPPRRASRPSARPAAIADANVQPVPCVLRLSMRGVRNSVNVLAVEEQVDDRIVVRVPADVPPLMTTAAGAHLVDPPRRLARVVGERDAAAAQHLRFRDVRRHDARAAAAARRAAPARRRRRAGASPLLTTITGSTTTSGSSSSSIAAATASTIAAVASMPILVACDVDVAGDRFDLRRDEIGRQRRHRRRRRSCSAR